MKSKTITFAIIVFLVIAIIAAILITRNKDKQIINDKIHTINGSVVDIEQRFFNYKPFRYALKGQRVYAFKYQIDNQIQTGYVRLGLFKKEKWILE